jgi:hypothetical protein
VIFASLCWYIFWSLGLFYSHFVDFEAISYKLWSFGIFFRFGKLCREKSGNPVPQACGESGGKSWASVAAMPERPHCPLPAEEKCRQEACPVVVVVVEEEVRKSAPAGTHFMKV